MRRDLGMSIILVLFFIFAFGPQAVAHDQSGNISGTVTDGTAPITNVYIQAFSHACGGEWLGGANTNEFGEYTIWNLSVGEVHVQACASCSGQNYVNEWWDGAAGTGTMKCNKAVGVAVTEGNTTPGIEFELERSGSVSGQVTGEYGPIEDLWVQAFDGPCWDTWLAADWTDEDGNYTLRNLPPGDVYVQTCAGCDHRNYIDEWFDNNSGTTDCNLAAPVTVVSEQTTPEIDFYLERGPQTLRRFDVTVFDGNLNPSFDIYPGFNNQLVSATLSLPNPNRGTAYEFDLDNDVINWDSECRYLVCWQHSFGPAEQDDYGEYTLTLEFANGAQETQTFTLQDVAVTPVDDASINVTINDDGSAHVSWDRKTTDNHYYQVRVRDENNKDLFQSSSQLNIEELDISANDLRCLETGKTYRWLVRAYHETQQYRAETREKPNVLYSPAALDNRTTSTGVQAWNGELLLSFNVRPGSRDHLDHVTVTGPNSFSYTFDLAADFFDLSTEARLGFKVWSKFLDLTAGSYGEYTFEVEFSDGHTEYYNKTLNEIPVTPVDSSNMEAIIHPDGAITFSWDPPEGVTGQNYQVRIRSADGSKEYYCSPMLNDGTQVTPSFWDLRALEHGQTHQWFVRAYDQNYNTMEQGGSLAFLYDPFPIYDATSAVFGSDSAVVTNTYWTLRLGGKLTYTGTGTQDGYGRYLEAVDVEEIDSVSCLKLLKRGFGNHPDPDKDPHFDYYWVARDNEGNVWVLQLYSSEEDETSVLGKSNAMMLMPANPIVGQIFQQLGEDYGQVQDMDTAVPQLSTGLGPFLDCLKLRHRGGAIEYFAPNIGLVKDVWDDGASGWELVEADTDGDGVHYDQDIFPHDPNEWLDTDSDGIGNNADTDDDNDGMPDDWELSYGLDPLVDDADGDLDGDGESNLDEYNAGTEPDEYDNHAPDQPVLSSPPDEAPDASLTPELQTGAFADPDSSDTHGKTQWQLSTDASFSSESIVLDITGDTHLTSLTMPDSMLTEDTTYYWRVIFYDNHENASAWSDAFSFTTLISTEDANADGIPDTQEVDETVDLDNNGIADIDQDDIMCVNTVVGDEQIGVLEDTNVESIECLRSIDPETIEDTTNRPETLPLGLISFRVAVEASGDTAEVIIYLSEAASTDAKWYKYDSSNGWQDYSDHATFSEDRTSLTLELKDGDFGDADGAANGIIVDPSGLAGTSTTPEPSPEPTPEPSGEGGAGGGCFIAASASGI
jgi:chitinase